jgi:hypothetical protein
MITDIQVQEKDVLIIQVNKKVLQKRFPYIALKFCYDVFNGCDIDYSQVEARFCTEDNEYSQETLQSS